MKIEVYKSQLPGKWKFRMIGKNGKTVATSDQQYARKLNALETAKTIAGRRMKVSVVE